jgi:hypothetical protein
MRTHSRHCGVIATGIALVAFAGTPGCGGKSARHVDSLDIDPASACASKDAALRGSTPVTTPVLEIDSTETVALDAKSPALLSQLRGLSGMRCAIEGDVLPFVDNNLPRLSATSYELLALPDGKVPMVGVVSVEDGQCVVTTEKGTRYWIHGDLVGVLTEYAGARVWVVGDGFDTDSPTRPKKSTPLTATGYGVVEEAPHR